MRVTSLHIDRFGILGEQDVRGLSPGVNVFVGRNEAGKSTCLRFFQSMLFGYKRGNRSLDPLPARGGKTLAGGSLFLDTDLGKVVLTRRPGAHGGQLTLTGPAGEELDHNVLPLLSGNMTVDVFDSIFAFSLKSLMDFSALSGEQVRHALHGAAFGTGLRSPTLVLKKLNERMALYLKADTGSAAINTRWRELQAVQEELRARAPDMDVYAALQGELDSLELRLLELRRERSGLDESLRRVRRRCDVWEQWEAVRRVRAELDALGIAAGGPDQGAPADRESSDPAETGRDSLPSFAPDAVQRLDSLLTQRDERLLAVQEHERDCKRLEADMAALDVPDGLAHLYPAVQTLREQKERRRSEAEMLPSLCLEYDHLAGAQAETLARLGPGWDAARVAAADLSLPAGQRLQRLGEALEAGEQALGRAGEECSRLAEELAEAVRQEDQARAAAARGTGPEQALPDAATAADLAADCVRARAALAEIPLVRERLERAEAEVRVSLTDIDPVWTQETLEAFDASPGARQRFADASGALARAKEEETRARATRALAGQALAEAQRAADAAAERLSRYAGLPDSAALETRRGQLRQLQRLGAELDAARREYEAANEAVSNLVAPLRSGRREKAGLARNPLFLAGGQLVLAGLALAGGGFLGASPSLLYAGAILALSGFLACLFHGKAAPGEEERGDENALCRVRTVAEQRKNALADSLAALMRQAAPWLQPLVHGEYDGSEPGDAVLARAAQLLESQGRDLALAARDREDCAAAQAVLAEERLRLERAEGELQGAGRARQRAGQEWVQLLERHALSPELYPENAAGLFDRVAAARARASAAAETSASLRASLALVAACIQKAEQEPFFALALREGGIAPPGSEKDVAAVAILDEAALSLARQALRLLDGALLALRDLQEAEQGRLRLESVLSERKDSRERLAERLAGAEAAREAAFHAAGQARQAWERELESLGLEEGLSLPDTLEALRMMRDFTAREKDRASRLLHLEALKKGLADFTREVLALAGFAGMALPRDPLPALEDGQTPDSGDNGVASPAALAARVSSALHLLDALGLQVESASRNAALLAEKHEQYHTRGQSLAGAESALALTLKALDDLLSMAGVPDAESFRSAFARFQRGAALRAEEQALLAGLRGLAGEESLPLEELLASLGHSSPVALRDEEAELARHVAVLEAEGAELAEKRGQILERRAALAGDTLQADLRGREAVLREDLHRLSRQWAVPALARELLLSAKKRFEEEGQEGVIRHAGDIFAAITGHEYTGIAASLDGGAFTALHRSGDRRDPERQLSQGTREQLYLSLRLAYVRNHAAKAEAMPVIMDDILVNFDPARAANTAGVLADFARHNQLFFFTCHPPMADLLFHAGVEASQSPEERPVAFSITKGEISALENIAGVMPEE